ncbi:MAG TPA: PilZ domain-containing protein [Candidatus Saccharimonadales bacterium]|jgi:hypothetical protein|nr:PilZ domain-containing protein [Candidatus Saccharimonadales bacterium]
MPGIHLERRKHPRYCCEVGVQVRTESSTNGYWGALADVSLGGCYVNTFSPLPSGTSVALKLQSHDIEINLSGSVATSHPGVGMGIQFEGFAGLEDEVHLKTLLVELGRGK